MNEAIKKYITGNTRKLLDMFSEGVVITDENMVVLYVNPSFLEYAEMMHEDFVGHRLPDVRPNAILPGVMASKKPAFNVHRIIPRGDTFTESYVDDIPLFENGEIVGALIVVRDARVLQDLFKKIKEQNEQVERLGKHLRSVFTVKCSFDNIIGMEAPFGQLAKKASKSDGAVLLLGESGTGKEVMAQSIHNASERAKGPFVDINCAALPENLLESELFGYAPGAFTGASKSGKMGLFEVANGGTVFLDEITELPARLQGRLLRVLQEKHMRRLGENKNINVDVKIIAASNKNIENLVNQGSFREDLFFRLAMFVINIPPIRERKKDLSAFIKHFLSNHCQKMRHRKTFSDDAMQLLLGYSWPGNVREIKNAINYACDVADGELIVPEDLPGYIFKRSTTGDLDIDMILKDKRHIKLVEVMDNVEREFLRRGLIEFGHTLEGRQKMAKALGISIATLYNKLRKHKLA